MFVNEQCFFFFLLFVVTCVQFELKTVIYVYDIKASHFQENNRLRAFGSDYTIIIIVHVVYMLMSRILFDIMLCDQLFN